MRIAAVHCLRLFAQAIRCPLPLALARAGGNRLAKRAMMANTTSSSIKVKARLFGVFMCASKPFCHARPGLPQNIQLFHADRCITGDVVRKRFEDRLIAEAEHGVSEAGR